MKSKASLTPADLELMSQIFPTKDEVRQIVDEIVHEAVKQEVGSLPTKEEFFSRMDSLAGDYKSFLEETPIINEQLQDHADRIEVVENRLNIAA